MKNKFLPVTTDMAGNWLYFKESDVRKACKMAGCDEELIEECVEEMRDKEVDCTTCFMNLISELDLLPVYEDEKEAKNGYLTKIHKKEKKMREIKFRAWDKKRKKMIYLTPEVDPKNCGNLVYCDIETLAIGLHGGLYLLDECGNWEYPDNLGESYEIMQFTGLKDKNGKEIYEGDIVRKITDDFALWNETKEPIGEVFYEDGCFCVGRKFKVALGSIKCEVIGNIYEPRANKANGD